ncbi:unnamed protein product [Calypogeia fissa]
MAFYQGARGNYAHQARYNSRQAMYDRQASFDQDNAWSDQDARSNAPQSRAAHSNYTLTSNWHQRGRGAVTPAEGVSHHPQPATFNFHNPVNLDQHDEQGYNPRQQERYGYSQFSNPMWDGNVQHRNEEEGHDSGSQGTGDEAALHANQQNLHSQDRFTRKSKPSLSKRLGFQMPRVEIPRGDIPAAQLPP